MDTISIPSGPGAVSTAIPGGEAAIRNVFKEVFGRFREGEI
jgi:hypothetical protein